MSDLFEQHMSRNLAPDELDLFDEHMTSYAPPEPEHTDKLKFPSKDTAPPYAGAPLSDMKSDARVRELLRQGRQVLLVPGANEVKVFEKPVGSGLASDFYDANVKFFKATAPYMFHASGADLVADPEEIGNYLERKGGSKPKKRATLVPVQQSQAKRGLDSAAPVSRGFEANLARLFEKAEKADAAERAATGTSYYDRFYTGVDAKATGAFAQNDAIATRALKNIDQSLGRAQEAQEKEDLEKKTKRKKTKLPVKTCGPTKKATKVRAYTRCSPKKK